ncbi:hypothetical protein Zmor_002978 [Zophobas morio]|uniref:Uncharacterized protein n=1 Tax=Zophobas morio TaxID=2755281 RepID=A0AA38HNA6_9CUCU|nr:hypothetical protein Zmor_002978 [Zophobas morio]
MAHVNKYSTNTPSTTATTFRHHMSPVAYVLPSKYRNYCPNQPGTHKKFHVTPNPRQAPETNRREGATLILSQNDKSTLIKLRDGQTPNRQTGVKAG